MSISIQVHGRKDPAALAELIQASLHDGGVLDREPQVAHFAALVHAEERELARRQAAWHWLNSVTPMVDRENDWSDV
jgi:hypothetical protein